MDGWVGGWMDGWMGEWMGIKAVLRIAYSNKKITNLCGPHHKGLNEIKDDRMSMRITISEKKNYCE